METDFEKDSELKRLWEEAVDEYLNRSESGAITAKWKNLVGTGVDLDGLIEQHESEFSRFRNHRKKFWDVFMATMTQLQRLGKVAQAGIGSTSFAPASIIVEAGLFLINAGSAVTDTYDSLEDLFKRIRDITDRLDEYVKGNIDRKLRKVVVKLLCSLLDVFCEARAAVRRGRGKEMMRRVVGKENNIQKTLDKLDEMVRDEINLITAKTYATTQHIDEKAEADRNRELLRQTLYTDAARDNEAFHAGIESSRISLSGNWLLKEKLFDKWVRREFPVLWIMGSPGTGKTYLASRVVSHLQQNPSSGLTSYFYIREGMNTQHTPEVILKTMANQITRVHEAYRDMAIAACRDENFFSPDSIWNSLFVKPFKSDIGTSRPLFIIIDGVDEAVPENQELLVKVAKSLSDSWSNKRKAPAIQLLLLGRPDLDYNVSNAWRGEKRRPKIIYIKPALSKADIEKFIKKGVDEGIPLLKKLSPAASKKLRREIIRTLADSSKGMFMIAKLMLTEIKNMNKEKLIRDALAQPPRGLEDMFKRVITRLTVMGGFDKEDLNEMIMWVACAKRDLLLGELDLVLKLRDLGQNGIIGLDDELRTRFGSFFSIINPEGDVDDEGDEEDEVSVIGSEFKGQSASSVSGYSAELQAEVDTDSNLSVDIEGEDEDNDDGEDTIPDRYFVATVNFSHASVGQHFRAAPFHEGIGMNINLAQAHIATTCLLFLTGNVPKRNERLWRQPDLFHYSADHFLDHLAEVQPEILESLCPIQLKQLSEEILVLFRDPSSLRRWLYYVSDKHKFICQLFSLTTRSRLRACIPEPSDNNANLDAQAAPRAKDSFEFLFEPFARTVAEDWFLLKSCDRILAVLFLRAYVSTLSDSPGQWKLPPNRPFEHIAEDITPEEIRQMASLGKLDKTHDWHMTLGFTLRGIKTPRHRLASLEEFRNAIQKESNSLRARSWEVDALFELGEYRETIAAAANLLEDIPSDSLHARLRMFHLIQDANLRLGNQEAALAMAEKAWESSPTSLNVGFNMIYASHKTGHFHDTVRVVESLLSPELALGAEVLGEMMRVRPDVGDYISIACQETGQLGLARDAFIAVANQAITSRNSPRRARADAELAKWYYRFHQDDQTAISMWEKVIKEYPESVVAVDASFELAQLYFMNAMDSGTPDQDSWILKLRRLVWQWETQTNPDIRKPAEQISALIGRWFAQRGDVDLARSEILPLVKLAICDLTDTTDMNDYNAYWNLGRALVCFGDRTNAQIAYAFIRPLEKSKELLDLEANINDSGPSESKLSIHEKNTDPNMPFNMKASCDGGCNRREVDFRSFSTCEVCMDIDFCDECLQKLKDGRLSFRVCNPKHSHLETYPPRGLVTKGARGYMARISDERVVTADEWIGMIRREWLGA